MKPLKMEVLKKKVYNLELLQNVKLSLVIAKRSIQTKYNALTKPLVPYNRRTYETFTASRCRGRSTKCTNKTVIKSGILFLVAIIEQLPLSITKLKRSSTGSAMLVKLRVDTDIVILKQEIIQKCNIWTHCNIMKR